MSGPHDQTTLPPGAFWDRKFDRDDYFYGTEANAFLKARADRLPETGRALSVADGEGRNAVWLAQRGLSVTAVDASSVAQEKAARLARERGVAVDFLTVDLRGWDWPRAAFDVVAATFFHTGPDIRAALHARMAEALAPGGILILEGFTPRQIGRGSGGPPVAEMMFTADMLRADFAMLDIVELGERETVLDEGPGHRGPAHVVDLIARRQ